LAPLEIKEMLINLPEKMFKERFAALPAFKATHGNCNATNNPSSEYKSLGMWSNHMRVSSRRYKKARLHVVYYRRIILGDLKDWALNEAGILLFIRKGVGR